MKKIEILVVQMYMRQIVEDALSKLGKEQAAKITKMFEDCEYPYLQMMEFLGILPEISQFIPKAGDAKDVNFVTGIVTDKEGNQYSINAWLLEGTRELAKEHAEQTNAKKTASEMLGDVIREAADAPKTGGKSKVIKPEDRGKN